MHATTPSEPSDTNDKSAPLCECVPVRSTGEAAAVARRYALEPVTHQVVAPAVEVARVRLARWRLFGVHRHDVSAVSAPANASRAFLALRQPHVERPVARDEAGERRQACLSLPSHACYGAATSRGGGSVLSGENHRRKCTAAPWCESLRVRLWALLLLAVTAAPRRACTHAGDVRRRHQGRGGGHERH
jgi:hypothetical protein